MANSADPDQSASSEANLSGSTLFAKAGHISGFSRTRVKKDFLSTSSLYFSFICNNKQNSVASKKI